jgi:hypothetical protein
VNAHEVDLGDVSHCGTSGQCITCPNRWGLQVIVLDTALGVFCATQCPRCIDEERLPEITDNMVAAQLVAAHCEHLGITQRRMLEILDEERQEQDWAYAS